MEVGIERLNEQLLVTLGVRHWPIWEKEVSDFDWYYDMKEQCLFLEGEVTIVTEDGREYQIKKGDFVTFPEGLACVWHITSPVKKHYKFG